MLGHCRSDPDLLPFRFMNQAAGTRHEWLRGLYFCGKTHYLSDEIATCTPRHACMLTIYCVTMSCTGLPERQVESSRINRYTCSTLCTIETLPFSTSPCCSRLYPRKPTAYSTAPRMRGHEDDHTDMQEIGCSCAPHHIKAVKWAKNWCLPMYQSPQKMLLSMLMYPLP